MAGKPTDTHSVPADKRYYYYWLGRKHQADENLSEAIKAYLKYAIYLDKKDQHIPHQWISNFYNQLGDPQKSLHHLEIFARGCSPPRAAEEYKKIGEGYLSLNAVEKAILNFEKAIEINPKIGVKKVLDNLRKT